MVNRVVFYEQPARIASDICAEVENFLENYIPEGTVLMLPQVYRHADMWSVAYGDDNKILGFAAHRVVPLPGAQVVQIMATFLSPALRGKVFSTLLLQGQVFLKAWLSAPFTTIFWCTRTRVPAAYAAALHANDVLPDLNDRDKNRQHAPFARCLAAYVYGNHISLDPDTYVLNDSYPPESIFVALNKRGRKYSPIGQYFKDCLDYESNEAIFIMGRMRKLALLEYLVGLILFRCGVLFGRVNARWHLWPRSS